MKALFILTIVVSLQLTAVAGIHRTGVCSFRKGLEKIDFSPLAHHVLNIKTATNNGFREIYWNPCSPESGGVCRAALCGRYTQGSNRLISLASQSTGRLLVEDHDLFLQYSTFHGSKISILLTCTEEETKLFVDKHLQQQRANYLMTLSSRYACWREIPPVKIALLSNTTSNVTVPTPPTPHVATATAVPSDGPAIAFLLLIEVLATILILLVLLSGVFVYLNYKLKQRRESATPPAYEQLYLDDETMLKL